MAALTLGLERLAIGAKLGRGLDLAVIGLIDLHNFAFPAQRRQRTARRHRHADTVRHEPSSFKGDAQRAVKLVSRHALLRRREQVGGQKPFVQRHFGSLKHRANGHGELLAAAIALVETLTLCAFRIGCGRTSANAFESGNVLLTRAAAMRANGAVRPALRFKVGADGVFILKDRAGKGSHWRLRCIQYGFLELLCQVYNPDL